jgi:hypothetical protein
MREAHLGAVGPGLAECLLCRAEVTGERDFDTAVDLFERAVQALDEERRGPGRLSQKVRRSYSRFLSNAGKHANAATVELQVAALDAAIAALD